MTQPTLFDFSAYIAERTQHFTGREWVFAEIDRWLAHPDAPRILLLAGEPGIGKTAVAARLTQFSTGEAAPPVGCALVGPDFLSAVHFCSARNGGWISPEGFTRSLSAQLAARYPAFAGALVADLRLHVEQHVAANLGTLIGAQITTYYAESPEALFNGLVRQPLHALCREGFSGPLAALVDGLDEALSYGGRLSIVRLLSSCGDLPPQVRLLLTSRPVDGVLEPFRPLQPFILYAHSAENQKDVRAYVRHRFTTSSTLRDWAGDEPRVEHVMGSLVNRSGGNFLVVSQVLDGIERGELSPDDPKALPTKLQDLYAWFLDRVVQADMRVWRDLYRPVLGVLAVAQESVDVSTIIQWIGLTFQQVTDVLHDLQEFLDPALYGRYRVYHESVVDFLTSDKAGPYYLDVAQYHRQIAATYIQRFIENREAWSDCDLYGLLYLPFHLVKAGQPETLWGLLFDFNWLQAKLEATDIMALLADFDLAPDSQHLGLVQGALRLSAHVLARDKTELAGQLLGRLLAYEIPQVQALLEQAKQWQGAPWLRPLIPSLTLPGGPLLRTLQGHKGPVEAMALTPDGRQIVSAGDCTLRVWDMESGQVVRALTDPTGGVSAMALTSDGKRAVSVANNVKLNITGLTVWDMNTGHKLYTHQRHPWLVEVKAIIPDSQCIIYESGEYTMTTPDGQTHTIFGHILEVWNLGSGQKVHTLIGHTKRVPAVAIIPNSKCIISASADSTLKVWDLESGQPVHTLIGHTEGVNAVAVTPDGKQAVSASDDGTLKVWDLESGQEVRTLVGHLGKVTVVTISPDGRYIVSASYQTLKVWDRESGQELYSLWHYVRATAGPIKSVTFAPDGKWFVSASLDRTLMIWDLASGQVVHTCVGHTGCVNAVAVTPDGKRAVSASDDGTLKVWDISITPSTRSQGVQDMRNLGHASRVEAVAFTPDGKRAMSASREEIKVWDLASGQAVHTLVGPRAVNAAALTADGTWIVFASGNILKVWDLESEQEAHTLVGHTGYVRALAVTSDSKRVVSASDDNTIRIWDLESGQEVQALADYIHYVYHGVERGMPMNAMLAVTSDGKRVVSASANTLTVWDLESGHEMHILGGHAGQITTLTVTPNGEYVVSASTDHTLKVWDLESGQEVHTLVGHTLQVDAVAITPNGKRAVSASQDGILKIWNLKSGQEVRTLAGHTEVGRAVTMKLPGYQAVTVTSDGKRAVSASDDDTLKIWDLEGGGIIASFSGEDKLGVCSVTLDGRTIIAGGELGQVHLLRLEEIE